MADKEKELTEEELKKAQGGAGMRHQPTTDPPAQTGDKKPSIVDSGPLVPEPQVPHDKQER